ncbi:hypothetical protein [Actinoplanes philippinensis]|uniref:hypothetical protein n=1 Tax=Actinoplanes philippinensis TaxID=35752 RepID=UPI0033D5063C
MGTAEDFLDDLRRLRGQAGDPSFRQLSRISAGALPPSTISDVLAGKRLPRLPRIEFVEAYVAACTRFSGRDDAETAAEVARWRDRWRALATPEKVEEPAAPPRRRSPAPLRLAAVFLAGLGVGVAGTLGWTGRHTPVADAAEVEPPDTCVPEGTPGPAGQDVLGLPSPGQKGGSWWVNEPRMASLSTDGHRFRADISAGTSRPGDVLVVKGDVALVQGRSYALAFVAAADRATTIRVRVQDNHPPAYQPSYDRELNVDPASCRHIYHFVAEKSSEHSELTFQVGGRPYDFRLQISDPILTAV